MVPPAPSSSISTMTSPASSLDAMVGRANVNDNLRSSMISCSTTGLRQRTYMSRLILRMQECLQEIAKTNGNTNILKDDDGGNAGLMRRLEKMAILIHESMSTSSRNYHSVQHVFDISRNLNDPIAVLAALFHDVIYYHVDGGLSDLQRRKLQGAIVQSSSNLPADIKAHTMAQQESSRDDLLCMVECIFGYTAGQVVTHTNGLNEFLSAVICVRELQDLLPDRAILAQLAACIEATIPFRPVDAATGKTAMDALYDNLTKTNEVYDLGMTEQELVKSVQRAVLLANEDVGNFGTTDRGYFLDNTWNLLPESNEALRQVYLYTAKEFQFAVFKMHKFFGFLQPKMIFQQFAAVPTDREMVDLRARAERNLQVGRTYVNAKLLSISVLAAFAELTGGDAPISMFMGDLPHRHRVSCRLEDSLPCTKKHAMGNPDHCDPEVYDLLAVGRSSETNFDVKHSPLAAYMYGKIGNKGLEDVLSQITVYPMNADVARQLLERLPRSVVTRIATNMMQVAVSRAEQIRSILRSLEEKTTEGEQQPQDDSTTNNEDDDNNQSSE